MRMNRINCSSKPSEILLACFIAERRIREPQSSNSKTKTQEKEKNCTAPNEMININKNKLTALNSFEKMGRHRMKTIRTNCSNKSMEGILATINAEHFSQTEQPPTK